jgi:hypothetical protein
MISIISKTIGLHVAKSLCIGLLKSVYVQVQFNLLIKTSHASMHFQQIWIVFEAAQGSSIDLTETLVGMAVVPLGKRAVFAYPVSADAVGSAYRSPVLPGAGSYPSTVTPQAWHANDGGFIGTVIRRLVATILDPQDGQSGGLCATRCRSIWDRKIWNYAGAGCSKLITWHHHLTR